MVHAWQGKGDRAGMPADVQVCWHDPTAHVQRFFPLKVQKQTTVMSLDDVTDVLLMYIGGGIKGSAHETEGLGLWFWFLVWLSVQLVPQLVHLGSHRPSNLATLVPLEEWIYNQTGKCSLFVLLYVLKVILGTLSWCDLVVCKLIG